MSTIIRAMTAGGEARILIADTTETVNKSIEIHKTLPTATAALGRALTAASMIGSLMPEKDDLLTLRFQGDGEGGRIVVSADYMGNVRGFIQNPGCDLPLKPNGKLDVAGCVGNGFLYVLRDNGVGEPYQGVSEIVSGEIAEDIAYYYATSEQIPTACVLGVLVDTNYRCKSAGGFLFQLLPALGIDFDEEIVNRIEQNIKSAPPFTTLLSEKGIEGVLAVYLQGIEYDRFDELDCGYVCACSREKTDRALIALGKKDLDELIDNPDPIEMTCQFCDNVYLYSKEELRVLRNGGDVL